MDKQESPKISNTKKLQYCKKAENCFYHQRGTYKIFKPINDNIVGASKLQSGRSIEKERKLLAYLGIGLIFWMLIPITICYYLFAKIVFGMNLYVSAILAGISGGLWSLGISKGFDFYNNALHRENWYSPEEFYHLKRDFSKKILFFVSITIIEIVIIVYFHF